MTDASRIEARPIATYQPATDAPLDDWIDWFWEAFLPGWILHARDTAGIGFVDELDNNGQPAKTGERTILAQARLLYTFSHLALRSDNPVFRDAAQVARDAMPAFRKPSGAYCRVRHADGAPTPAPADAFAKSYDQSFIILALATWGRQTTSEDVTEELESCWHVLSSQLTDPATGLLLEHDGLDDPTAASAPHRAQNPHMHLYEAALQAFEMTGNRIWLERAGQMRAKGLAYFFDDTTGTIMEFIAPDLSRLAGREGEMREVGHQCEWAWLLLREVELGGDPDLRSVANRLLAFADRHGFAPTGEMQWAAYDGVSCQGLWHAPSFLLWPQTEAIKTHALRAQNPIYAERARALTLLIFKRYFAGRPAFVNQLDINGHPIWPDALSRLLYHLVLALTEGARAGLWKGAT